MRSRPSRRKPRREQHAHVCVVDSWDGSDDFIAHCMDSLVSLAAIDLPVFNERAPLDGHSPSPAERCVQYLDEKCGVPHLIAGHDEGSDL